MIVVQSITSASPALKATMASLQLPSAIWPWRHQQLHPRPPPPPPPVPPPPPPPWSLVCAPPIQRRDCRKDLLGRAHRSSGHTDLPRTLYMTLSPGVSRRWQRLITTHPRCGGSRSKTHLAARDARGVRSAIAARNSTAGGQVFLRVPRVRGIREWLNALRLIACRP